MKKLGRGLSDLGLNELMGGITAVKAAEAPSFEQLHLLSVDLLIPGQYQPRQLIDQEALMELAESIRAQGIIQPLIVRPGQNNHYEIIAGERRWRAAKIAGLTEAPVIIRDISDQTAIAFGLIENIQRRDLNAIEEAEALQRLLHEFKLTHEEIAQIVGKSRASISNLLRLLQLNAEVKNLLLTGKLEMGHGRALLALDDEVQIKAAQEIMTKELSVRETEALVKNYAKGNISSEKNSFQQFYAVESQQNLMEKLGAKVAIKYNSKGKGKIVIQYHNLDELAGILTHIH